MTKRTSNKVKKGNQASVQDSSVAVQDQPQQENTPMPKGMAKLARYRVGYVDATHNGDELGFLLDGRTLETTAMIGERVLGQSSAELLERYAHLNNGQKRMNIGNRIRAAIRKNPELLAVAKSVVGQ